MSRAFVREPDDIKPEPPSELPVSSHANLVTARGLELIDAQLAKASAGLEASTDDQEKARLRRDLRYWTSRRATAQLTPAPYDPQEVGFGSRISLRRGGRTPETLQIVGEDEADPAAGRISWVSPLASALMGAQAGEVVEVGPREPPLEVEVLAVDNAAGETP